MEPLTIAIIVAVFTLIVLFSGIPIAFGLSFVSIALLVAFEGVQMLDVFAETFFFRKKGITPALEKKIKLLGCESCRTKRAQACPDP